MKENVSDSIFVAPFKMKCQIEMRPFLRHRGLGVFGECLGYWFQEHVANKSRFSLSSENMQWHLGVLWSHAIQGWKQKISHYQRWLPIQPIHSPWRHIVLVRQLPLPLSLNKLQVQMTKIPKESADQKDSVWYYQGSCMPKTLLWSKAILFGGSTWLSKCVRALHFPLLGFETGLERETAWNYWDIFYKDLLQVTFDIRTGNTKDGWKKHGIDRQPFFWFGTLGNKITYDQDS